MALVITKIGPCILHVWDPWNRWSDNMVSIIYFILYILLISCCLVIDSDMYTVYEWEDENGVSVVSQKWLCKEWSVTYCYWPPVRMSKAQQVKALQKHKMPEVDWTKHTGRVLSTTGMFAWLILKLYIYKRSKILSCTSRLYLMYLGCECMHWVQCIHKQLIVPLIFKHF